MFLKYNTALIIHYCMQFADTVAYSIIIMKNCASWSSRKDNTLSKFLIVHYFDVKHSDTLETKSMIYY